MLGKSDQFRISSNLSSTRGLLSFGARQKLSRSFPVAFRDRKLAKEGEMPRLFALRQQIHASGVDDVESISMIGAPTPVLSVDHFIRAQVDYSSQAPKQRLENLRRSLQKLHSWVQNWTEMWDGAKIMLTRALFFGAFCWSNLCSLLTLC